MSEARGYIDLLSIKKLTQNHLYLLLEKYGGACAIRNAPQQELRTLIGTELARLIKVPHSRTSDEHQYQILQNLQVRILPYFHTDYPHWLKDIGNFPPVLFIRGAIQPADESSIALIGTRGATVYGKRIAAEFAREFIGVGMTIISGMARGIDTVAHQTALEHGGRTIAVLGCGVDICYPPENASLMKAIIKHGAVISEFNINTPPLAQHFPKRNRIVSGMARAVVAIEAKEKSGVMNTVRWALDQGKEVFAIPGNIYSKASSGTNRLIKEGAIPVTSAHEVLEYLGITHNKEQQAKQSITLSESEQSLWQYLTLEPVYLDVLSDKLNQPTAPILNTLLQLEMKGLVQQLPGMMFVKKYH